MDENQLKKLLFLQGTVQSVQSAQLGIDFVHAQMELLLKSYRQRQFQFQEKHSEWAEFWQGSDPEKGKGGILIAYPEPKPPTPTENEARLLEWKQQLALMRQGLSEVKEQYQEAVLHPGQERIIRIGLIGVEGRNYTNEGTTENVDWSKMTGGVMVLDQAEDKD